MCKGNSVARVMALKAAVNTFSGKRIDRVGRGSRDDARLD